MNLSPTLELLKRAIRSGNPQLLDSFHAEDEILLDKELPTLLRRSSERVVWHRSQFRDVIVRVIELGVDCDIWTAARAGILQQVEVLLRENQDLLNAKDMSGCTPLQRAALVYGVCKDCEEVVDFLFFKGAAVDIFSAATFGLTRTVGEELKRDDQLISERCTGSTALNWAVRPRRNMDESPAICRLLLHAGADVHDKDKHEDDMTPLHHAAEWGPEVCIQLADLLLDAGADINREDRNGWTPLQYAIDRGRDAMAEHLLARGAKPIEQS